MFHATRAAMTALLGLSLGATGLAAQLDYRNLDDERPVGTEDAYPVEHYAFEILAPLTFATTGGAQQYLLAPEVEYGVLANTQVGLKLPLAVSAASGTSEAGAGGLAAHALYNFNTESRVLPAFALRGDVNFPVGSLGGDGVRFTLKAIATRSWGRWRTHLNLLGSTGSNDDLGIDALPRWAATVAVDRTFFRESLLLIGELAIFEASTDATTQATVATGLRWQWTPTLVLDTGVSTRLTATGPDFTLTLGFSHVLAFRGLMPRIAPVEVSRAAISSTGSAPDQRSEQFYYPGSFNWQFLSRYPEGARLFNAFDYGHAVLYETLLTRAGGKQAQALDRQYDYLTTNLLVRPPRFAVAEEVIEPSYARLAWDAKQMFDWAHLLHRQIYDIYSDERLSMEAKDSEIERVTDYYLSRPDQAFTTVPKSMQLMDAQPFSRVFRTTYPAFNGLIWAYHWLQVGLYEPLIVGKTADARKAGLQAAVARFWQMLEDPPASMPREMPMTASIAPEFSRRHTRAAVIFDNLHMMHDIISDILLSDVVPRNGKRAEIYRQLAEFRDGGRNVMTMDEWRMMGEMMGGVGAMGGPATGLLPDGTGAMSVPPADTMHMQHAAPPAKVKP